MRWDRDPQVFAAPSTPADEIRDHITVARNALHKAKRIAERAKLTRVAIELECATWPLDHVEQALRRA